MINQCINERLQRDNLSINEFQELLIRLLNYGILCRNESQTEQQLYDRYLRVSDLVNEYLALIGIRIFHEQRFEYIRLYPPGSELPGMGDAEYSTFGGSLRRRLRQEEVALILVLSIQYDKALQEGLVDENGYVVDSFESISIAMKNILGRHLPDKMTDRKRLFQRLKQLRLITYKQDDDIESGEAWLKIHPMIVSFVSEDALQSLSNAGDPQAIEHQGNDAIEPPVSENPDISHQNPDNQQDNVS
ncbi:MAG: DUF4194 domain-containing protein [Gammaproteobacteria bacterium]|nr:DUF4194 domain-containing protein [Gammaproteobacteria bacterium]